MRYANKIGQTRLQENDKILAVLKPSVEAGRMLFSPADREASLLTAGTATPAVAAVPLPDPCPPPVAPPTGR